MRAQLAREIRAKAAAEIVMKLRRDARIHEFDINGKPKPTSASKSFSTGIR